MDERQFRIDDLAGMLRRRWRLLVAGAGSVFLLAILIAAILPNRYVASTTLLVEPQSVSKRLVDGGVESEDLAGRLHLLTMQILSRARLSRIIDDLGLYPELADEMTREEIIEYMRGQIWVEPVQPALDEGRSRGRVDVPINTFRLFFRHERGGVAAAVANRLASDFIDEHIRERVRSSGDTAEFIEAELARLATRTQEVEAAIGKVKAENVGSLPEDMAASQARLARTYEALRLAQQRHAEAESDAVFYQQQAKAARISMESTRGDVVGRAVTPALRLRELEIQLGAYRARGLTDRHPDVVIAEAEAAEIRSKLDGEESEFAPSAVEQEAIAQAERARQRAASVRAEIERLAQEAEAIETRINATPRVAEQLEALQREWISLNQSFQSYSAKRLEAGVAANMERRQKGEQFRVLEPAFAPPSPASPNRPAIMLVGAVLGLVLGAGLALLREVTDSSYHAARSLQESLRIPVLAAIPAILLDADRRALRRRQMREAMAAGAVTATVLLVSAAGYAWVNMPGLWGGGADAAIEAPAAAPTNRPAPTAAPAPLSPTGEPAAMPAAPSGR